jgi:hypothetical protein
LFKTLNSLLKMNRNLLETSFKNSYKRNRYMANPLKALPGKERISPECGEIQNDICLISFGNRRRQETKL